MSGPVVDVHVPGDKSVSHRGLILGALADGRSRLRGLLAGADPRSTGRVLRAIGVAVPELSDDGSPIRLEGGGPRGLRAPAEMLDCGNSGTTARLMLGVLAGCAFSATLTGDASLRKRPMRRVTDPLSRMGARFAEVGEPDRLPIRVHGGRLGPLEYAGPRASAQVKSALLLAGLTGGATVRVSEPHRSRDHTERLLEAMGAEIRATTGPDGRHTITLEPPDRLRPLDLTVPGDFSSAAFLIALALLSGRGTLRIHDVGLNPTRTGLLPVLRRMGASVRVAAVRESCGEPVGTITVEPSRLRATEVGGAEIPGLIDEVPIVAVLAARAEGETRITGAGELRVKESDRLAALAENLRAVGVDVEELPDGLVIAGTDEPLAGRVRSFGDHRIAMAFGALAGPAGQRIDIDDPDVARISYPGYWNVVSATSARLERR